MRRRLLLTWQPISSSSNAPRRIRSEEHTSELQSLRHLVCRLLLEKKKKTRKSPSADLDRRGKICSNKKILGKNDRGIIAPVRRIEWRNLQKHTDSMFHMSNSTALR